MDGVVRVNPGDLAARGSEHGRPHWRGHQHRWSVPL